MVPTPNPENRAPPTIVTVQFRVALTKQEVLDAFAPNAPELAKLPGLRWKVWSLDEATRSFAGVYLFDDPPCAEHFLAGPVVASLRREKAFSDVRAQAYPVLESLSVVTRAPLG